MHVGIVWVVAAVSEGKWRSMRVAAKLQDDSTAASSHTPLAACLHGMLWIMTACTNSVKACAADYNSVVWRLQFAHRQQWQ